MRRILAFLVVAIAMVAYLPAMSAVLDINGVVVDAATGEGLLGANVFIEGTMLGTATDPAGKFALEYETDDAFEIIVKFMGYKQKSVDFEPTDDVSDIVIELEEDVFMGEAVVVTGIASRTSKDVAEVSVSRVAASQLTVVNSYQDLSQMVAGKVAGVHIEPSSGNVGGGIRFNMRSGGGLNGDEQPLVIIDGVRVDNSEVLGFGVGGQGVSLLADLNPEDIETVEILKGPAGAATYGTSGSNGVVLITTKRGKLVPGKPKGISLDYKLVNGFNTQSYKYTEDDFLTYKDINRMFVDGQILHHSLSAYGGTGLMKYYVGLDRRYEHGILPTNDMDRYTLRANFDVYPSDKVLVSVSSSYTRNDNNRPNNDNNIFGYLGNTILLPPPYNYNFTDSASIAGYRNRIRSNRFIGSVQAQYIPIKDLRIRASIGVDDGDLRNDETFPANLPFSFYTQGRRAIWMRQNTQMTYTLDASYDFSPMDGLDITSIVGAQLYDRKWRTFWGEKMNFSTELITNIGAGELLENLDEGFGHDREAGIFTEHNIAFQDQYFLTLRLRNDYASSIGAEAPSVFYPGASFALRLDKYDFFPKLFTLMKIRAAYGETGVLPGTTDGIPLLWEAEESGSGVGAVPSAIGNPEIEPERIKETEFGFEAELLGKYSMEFTYYIQNATNSIIDFQNAPSTGQIASAVPYNVGGIDGWGIESLVQARLIHNKNITLDVSTTNNYQKNEVKDLGDAQPIFGPFDLNVIAVGLPKHAFYTWKVLGAAFNEDGTYAGPDVLVDENGEMVREFQGTPIPEYTGAFSISLRFLKNFNLYASADWATGHKVFNNTRLFAIYLGTAYGLGANDKEYRTLQEQLGLADWELGNTALEPGSDAYKEAADKYAKLNFNYDGNFLEEADFFKVREISLSYSFKDLISKIYSSNFISDLVLGVSARNVWTTTKYSGADLEVSFDGSRSLVRGQDFLTLQHPRVYNAWIRVSL